MRKLARLAVTMGMAAAVLAACGGQAGPASPSPSPSPTPEVTSSAPARSAPSPPPGGPAPAELIGTWNNVDPNAPEAPIVLTLTASRASITTSTGAGSGAIVVNGNEIDFFDFDACLPLRLPRNVGRYQWSLNGAKLHLAPLNDDPCGRKPLLTNQTFSKAGS